MAFIFHQWKYTIKRTDESRDCKMSPSEFSKHSLTISKLTVRLAWSAIGHQPQNQRQALFTETSFERNGLQRMFEQALSGWAILCVACQALLVFMLCTSANSKFPLLFFFTNALRQWRDHCACFLIIIGCIHRMMVWFSLSIGLVRRVKMQVEMRHCARQSWKIWLWIPSILEIVSILPSFMDLITVLATLNTKGKKSGLFKVSKISCFVWIEGWFTTTDFE